MDSHLLNGRINLGMLRESATRELLNCLDKCVGTKALVWDGQLSGPFGLIANFALLQDHGVTKMHPLEVGGTFSHNFKNIVFLTRPKLSLMSIVADIVRREEVRSGPTKEFHIFFIPRKSLICEKRLKELGVYGTFTHVDECCIELFPYDYDLMSMEMENSFKECCLENDTTSLFYVANALMTIQALYGVVKTVVGKGKCAKDVYELMLRMRREMTECELTPQIDTLILIDRSVDLLSPLATPLTYEGLIDEIFGIKHTFVKFPAEKFKEGSEQQLVSKEFVLNSGEELYAEIRDQHVNSVGQTLHSKAKLISCKVEEIRSAKTGEVKQFVKHKLPQMKSLQQSISNHKNICELINDVINSERFRESTMVEHEFLSYIDTDKVSPYIEECLANKDSLIKILRLVCMQSVANSGLKPKVLTQYKREILQTYGHQHIITLDNLEKAGLLIPQASKIYPTIKKTLKTIVDKCAEQKPQDIAYVHSGYAPMSVRLAQFLYRPGWKTIGDVLSLLPGPMFEEIQQSGARKRHGSGSSIQSSSEEQKVTLIFFLGGCTYAEIAALRFLSQQDDAPTDFIIATTNVLNGTSFLKSIM